jgi:hypothetical protein
MKIRKGFVSNSSTSSFTCDVCGATESGFDASVADVGFGICENGHYHCGCEVSMNDDCMKNDEDYGQAIKEECCPICIFDMSSKVDMKRYLYKEYKTEESEVLADVKSKNKRRRRIYDIDYVNYVYKKFNLQETDILNTLKETYKTYSEFLKYIRS